ncbi:MAG: THUMP domain-containing protein [Proteobacteria bacterium]|nr:THUMP domain-containing protein [Pseudomonadota bacterium]MCL2308311.1 THUMP domain-containing protein [Pseudomonadota bacterium]
MNETFFAPCPRGLENMLTVELARSGAIAPKILAGGVSFQGDLSLAYRANLESRLASRVLWRIARHIYRDEHDLYKLAYDIDWTRYFSAERTLRVDLTATRSPLTSLSFATLRIKDAVCDRFRAEGRPRPSIDKQFPDVRVYAYLSDKEVTLYLDTSGEALFKRGYRQFSEEAPLRENLAAGLLMLAGWGPDIPLLDPMCGSGTIATEAALIAARQAPGLHRSFAFQKLNWFDGPTWQRLKQKARDAVRPALKTPTIFASDISKDAIEHARVYATHAQVADWIDFSVADVRQREAPASSGIWLTNPPYGVRLEDSETLATLYPALGSTLKKSFSGWHAWFFSGDQQLPKLIGLKPERRIPLFNGALDCRLYGFKMVTGSMRRIKQGADVSS